MTRKSPVRASVFALMTIAAVVALSGTWGAGTASLSASEGKGRKLIVTKECGDYDGGAGAFCTITGSNLPAIKAGALIFYTQPVGIPAGLLDSNIVLDAGDGNRAVGRCTLDLATGLGLCTLSDGTGEFAGINARVNVSAMDAAGVNWLWEGNYSFDARD